MAAGYKLPSDHKLCWKISGLEDGPSHLTQLPGLKVKYAQETKLMKSRLTIHTNYANS